MNGTPEKSSTYLNRINLMPNSKNIRKNYIHKRLVASVRSPTKWDCSENVLDLNTNPLLDSASQH